MSDVDEVKKRIDIVEVVSEFVKLKKGGRNFKGLCPFHNEKTPSFMVSQEMQIFHCFGCGFGGDVFKFLMETEHIEFGEALSILAKRAGVTLSSNFPGSAPSIKEKLYEINHLASEFYQYLLVTHKIGEKALSYVMGRGITKASIKTFGVGYSPNAWDGLYNYMVLKKGYKSEDLETAGLLIRRSESGGRGYYDRFRGRLMFTLKDVRGNVLGFAGRVLDSDAKEAKYINTSETPVYSKSDVLYGMDVTKEYIKKGNAAVIVEGEIDLIRSYQAGVCNIVAIKGSALTDGQLRLLKRYTENITLSLDADLAGDVAARRGIEIADSLGFNIKVVQLLGGKDPDEAVKLGVWRDSVSKAVPIYDYLIDSAFKRSDGALVFGKKKIGDELIPIFSKISNDIVKAHYVKKLANRLGVSEEVISGALEKFAKKESLGIVARAVTTEDEKEKKSREEMLEERFLSMILQSGNPIAVFNNSAREGMESFFTIQGMGRVFEYLKGFLGKKEQGKFVISDFVKEAPGELSSIINRLYLIDLGSDYEKEEDKEGEAKNSALIMEDLYNKRRLGEISKLISEAEAKEEKGEVLRLNSEFGEISKKIAKQ